MSTFQPIKVTLPPLGTPHKSYLRWLQVNMSNLRQCIPDRIHRLFQRFVAGQLPQIVVERFGGGGAVVADGDERAEKATDVDDTGRGGERAAVIDLLIE